MSSLFHNDSVDLADFNSQEANWCVIVEYRRAKPYEFYLYILLENYVISMVMDIRITIN
jgi:hypothetical protein